MRILSTFKKFGVLLTFTLYKPKACKNRPPFSLCSACCQIPQHFFSFFLVCIKTVYQTLIQSGFCTWFAHTILFTLRMQFMPRKWCNFHAIPVFLPLFTSKEINHKTLEIIIFQLQQVDILRSI